MSEFSADQFTRTRYLTLVLRLAVDDWRGLIRGEVLDPDGETVKHFRGMDGLAGAVQWCVDRTSEEGTSGHGEFET